MNKLLYNIVYLLIGDGLVRLLGFFSTVYMTSVLTPESFGLVVIGLSVLAYGLWFSDMGIKTIATREYSRPSEQRRFRMADFIGLQVLFALLWLAAATLISFGFVRFPLSVIIPCYMLTALSSAVLLDWYFQALADSRPIIIYRIWSAGLFLLLLFLCVFSDDNLLLIPLLYSIAYITGALIMYLWHRNDPLFPFHFRLNVYAGILKESITVAGGILLAQIIPNLPPIVIGLMVSVADAGLFGIALKITFLILVIDRIFVFLYVPIATRLVHSAETIKQQAFPVILKLIILITVSLSMIAFIGAEDIFRFVFSESYIPAANIFRILIWYVPVTVINSFYAFALIARGHEKQYFKAMLYGGIAAGMIIIAMTPALGSAGAALGAVIGELIIMNFSFYQFGKAMETNYLLPIFKIAPVMAAVGAGSFLVTIPWYFLPLLWLLVVGIFILFRYITIKEIKILMNL